MLLHLPLFENAVQQLSNGKRVAMCAVVKTRGSAPQSPGAMMTVDESGNAIGTLGGGCIEAEVKKRAFELLQSGESQELDFSLDQNYGWDDGLVCGGSMTIAVNTIIPEAGLKAFQEVIDDVNAGRPSQVAIRTECDNGLQEYRVLVEAEPKLVIAGAGHVGTELARLCVNLEFDVTVIDDREEFANSERLPKPIHPIAGDIAETLSNYPIDCNTYVVIVTRGHKHDEKALAAVIDSKAKYLGMIGSKRKIQFIYDNLKNAGVTAEKIERVHAPIGLDINAVTVPEIAVSIAGELISIRRKEKHKAVEGPFPVSK